MGRALRGIRGATSARENTREAIAEATQELVQALLEANRLPTEDIASIIFTASPDLDAAFPAEAARALGLEHVPLLGATEMGPPDGLRRCIRVLLHVNTAAAQKDVRHVYLRDARRLRPDLPAAAAPDAGRPVPRPEVMDVTPYVPGKSPAEASRETGRRGPFLKLASNENPLGPSPKALEAARRALEDVHTYPDGAAVALRHALAEKWDLPPDRFIVGNGSDGIIKMIGEAYFQPGDDIIQADPTFSQYEFAAQLFGVDTVKVPLDRNWRHDLPAMADAIGPRTKAVFLCNPNNPTGTTVDADEFAAFMERVPPGVLVVVDEAYGEYARPADAFGRRWVERDDAHVVVLRTFSKIYGLAGLRVGYGMARPEIVDVLRRVQEPFQVNAPAQAAARAALADEDHVKTSRRMNEAGKGYFYDRAAALGFTWVPSAANFVFMDTGRDSREVAARLLERGIIVRAGEAFGQRTWLRVTVGTEAQNRRLFAALAEVVGQASSVVL